MENKMINEFNLETPCFVVDTEDFKNNIRRFSSALSSFFPSNIISYSVKTNSLPFLINVANTVNCYSEVVSYDEYNLVKKLGVETNHIIYNGPLKDKATFVEAISNGAYVNIETKREINWLIENKDLINGHIGIRLNIDLGIISPENSKVGEETSRFGFSYESGEFQDALNKLHDNNIKIDGLHVHRTSATRSLNVYSQICKYVSDIVNKLNLCISYLDIGGGYFGNYPGKPDYIDYVKEIYNSLNINDSIQLIVEPGNALVASSIKFYSKIIDKKLINDTTLLTVDGSRIDIDPFFHKKNYSYNVFTKSYSSSNQIQKVVGCTCLENDVLMELTDEKKLEIGDVIEFTNVGAYTMTLTPSFIRLQPTVYAYSNSEYKVVRNKFSVDQWINNSVMHIENKPAILFSNAGRRGTLIKNFKKSLGNKVKLIATDNWCVAPALFMADEYYVTPKIKEKTYIQELLNICKKENVKAITTCIDPEIELLSKNRDLFIENGILPLCPDEKTAALCFDKYEMFKYLTKCNINTVLTYDTLDHFNEGYKNKEIDFPVFIKPRCGSGSVGIAKVNSYDELVERLGEGKFNYIIQEFMDCEDFDADVYIDTISNKAVSAFSKKKIETRIGGASKTISFKDEKLFIFIKEIVKHFNFNGPVDMDFFYKDGKYYLSEVNPRFGGAYLHAYGAGVDFPKLIFNNINGIENECEIGNYNSDVLMMMYDEVVITTKDKLKGDYND